MTSGSIGSLQSNVTGVLAGGGSAMVRALVYHGEVPQHAPASLAEVIEPIADADGNIRDWRLNLPRLVSQNEPLQVRNRFLTWRQAYVTERLLGDVATVRSYVRWADRHTDSSALHVLNLPRARIDSRTAPRLAWQVHEVDRLLGDGERGLGIVSPQRTGLVRGFAVGDEPLVLLAEPTGSVAATRDALMLTTGLSHEPPASLPGSPPVRLGRPLEPPRTIEVRAWTVSVEGVTAITPEEEVPLGTGVGARLLVGVAPGVEQAADQSVPLRKIFGGISTHLRETAMLATNNRVPLVITTAL